MTVVHQSTDFGIKGQLSFKEKKSASQNCTLVQQSHRQPLVIEDLYVKQVTHSLIVVQVEAVVYT